MNYRMTALLASAALTFAAGSALAQTAPAPAPAPAAPPAPPSLMPAMSGSLAANSAPTSFDAGILGSKVYVTGALTGLVLSQTHTVPGDFANEADIDNAQVMINKADGEFQYFIQAGAYALPALGAGYTKSGPATTANFGYVPQAFVKIAPTSSFSVEGGKLPTLIGDEYTFSYENLNIERGLLWGLEPVVSKGIQANYSQGPFAGSFAFTDGFDSDHYNTLSGLLTWTIDSADTLAFAGEGSTVKTASSTFTAPAYLQNEQVYDVMYTHTMGPWTFNPYFQYTSTPSVPAAGISGFQTYGYALLANYAFDSKSPLSGVSVPVRLEYLNASMGKADAWSVTVTPTYQYKVFFVRGELSYTADGAGITFPFGSTGTAKNQARGLVETGVLF
jgi:hypothetical protein